MSLKDKDILIIDDAEDVRKLARKMLENEGATVREADTVEKGLELVSSVRPHLVLLDLNFGKDNRDGFSFLTHRKATSAWKDMPTVVLSGANEKTSVVRAITLGAADYLIKPFRSSALLQKVRKAMRISGYHQHVFPEAQRPTAKAEIQAQVQKVTEIGFQLDVSCKLEPDEVLAIECEFLNSLGAGQEITKTSSRQASYGGDGRYLNDLVFTGTGENFTKQMRKGLRGSAGGSEP